MTLNWRPWPLDFQTKYLDQRSLSSAVIARTHRQTHTRRIAPPGPLKWSVINLLEYVGCSISRWSWALRASATCSSTGHELCEKQTDCWHFADRVDISRGATERLRCWKPGVQRCSEVTALDLNSPSPARRLIGSLSNNKTPRRRGQDVATCIPHTGARHRQRFVGEFAWQLGIRLRWWCDGRHQLAAMIEAVTY